MAQIEYGFAGQYDAFVELAEARGSASVGSPLHEARYLGEDLAYQYTTRGKFEAVKLTDGNWKAYFFPEGIASSVEQTLTSPLRVKLQRPVPAVIELNVDNPFGADPGMYASLGYLGHPGIDYLCPVGTPVSVCDDGVVEHADEAGTAGIMVKVRHEHGVTRYLHLSQVMVVFGEQVRRGRVIGLSGNTGFSTGPHLHLDYFPDGADLGNGYSGRVDPLPLIWD